MLLDGARPPWWLALAGALLALGVLLDVLNDGLLVALDHSISRTMLDWGLRDGWTYKAVYPLTWFGQRAPVLVVSTALAAWLSYRARSIEPLIRLAVALVLLSAAVYTVKFAVGRDAPPVDALHTGAGASFPSGHVANAIIVWGVLAWLCARDARVQPTPLPWRLAEVISVVRLAAPVAVVVGMTLLDFHWMSDFVAGAGLGVALLWLATLPAPARIRPSAAR